MKVVEPPPAFKLAEEYSEVRQCAWCSAKIHLGFDDLSVGPLVEPNRQDEYTNPSYPPSRVAVIWICPFCSTRNEVEGMNQIYVADYHKWKENDPKKITFPAGAR